MKTAAALGLALAALIVGADHDATEGAALLRHLHLPVVVAAALRFGAIGGGATASVAVLLQAPAVFAAIERAGLTATTGERLVTFGLLVGVGVGVGRLADDVRVQRRRSETLLALPRALVDAGPVEGALDRLCACLRDHLDVDAVALVVRQDEAVVLAGADRVVDGSLALHVLTAGIPRFVPDVGGGIRPRRAFAAPMLVAAAPIGVLVVEREGELPPAERGALAALAAHCGLALEHARLVSRQRRFAEELAERIASATATKSTFVAVASHELRTPLTALVGFSELLSQRAFDGAEVRRMAELIHRETERLVRIVEDFLDLSRLERGIEPHLSRRRVEIGPAVAAAVEMFGRIGSHQLVVDCDQGLGAVDADPDALDRILKNLVSNALKYSPLGSLVRVGVRAQDGVAVEFSVHDTGRGIPAEALPRVFEPYYRAPGVGAARGAGLGLAVVKSLVDAHGGTIRLDSAPDRGTRVTFVLPSIP